MRRKRIVLTLPIVVLIMLCCGTLAWWMFTDLGDPKRTFEKADRSDSAGREKDNAQVVQREEEIAAPHLRFAPRDGERVAYGFALDGDAEIDLTAFIPEMLGGGKTNEPGNLTRLTSTAMGELQLKYYRAGVGVWDVAATVTEAKNEINGEVPGYASELGYPFSFRKTDRGELSDFRFARGTDKSTEAFFKGLLLSMQVVFPARASREWRTKEEDGRGQYTAAYKIEPEREGQGGEWEIRKRKLEYVNTLIAGLGINQLLNDAKTRIEEDLAKIVVPADGAWLLSIEQDIRLSQEGRGRVLSRGSEHMRAWRVDPTHAVEFPEAFPAFQAKLESGQFILAGLYATQPILDRMGKGLNMTEALNLYEEMKQSDTSNTHLDAEKFLVNYLRQYPEAGLVLVERLSTDPVGLDEDTQVTLWRLIVEAGHPEAQQAIMSAVLNLDYGETTRIRAMAYVTNFEYPTNLLIDDLWKLFENVGQAQPGSEDGQLKTMSILAIGNLGFRDKLNNDIRPQIEERLLHGLQGAETAWERRMALRAIGNYGDAGILDSVEPYFEDPDANVRSAAYLALRRMESRRAEQMLIDSYEKEQSPEVRQAALRVLASMQPTEAGVEWTRGKLTGGATVPDEQVAIVHLLGNSLEEYPDNEQSLREVLATNPPRAVKVAIYKYIAPK